VRDLYRFIHELGGQGAVGGHEPNCGNRRDKYHTHHVAIPVQNTW